MVDNGLVDIVAERYDAGVRAGGIVAQDMIAVRIGPDLRMAVVGSPGYFRKRPVPKEAADHRPQLHQSASTHTVRGLYAWEFEKGRDELKVRVDGQFVCNGTSQKLRAPPCLDWGWPMCRRTSWRLMSLKASLSACSTIGARRMPAITFLSEPAAVLGGVYAPGRH